MKRLLAMVFGLTMVMAAFGATASAAPPEGKGPGPNGHNEKGLCTAYFNGQKKGHEEGNGPGPFGQLEDDAQDGGENEDLVDEQQVSDDVFEFCDKYGIMGNPEHNGRFDCREGEGREDPARDSDDDLEVECVANGTETD